MFIAFKEIQDKNHISNRKEYVRRPLWYDTRFMIGKEQFQQTLV